MALLISNRHYKLVFVLTVLVVVIITLVSAPVGGATNFAKPQIIDDVKQSVNDIIGSSIGTVATPWTADDAPEEPKAGDALKEAKELDVVKVSPGSKDVSKPAAAAAPVAAPVAAEQPKAGGIEANRDHAPENDVGKTPPATVAAAAAAAADDDSLDDSPLAEKKPASGSGKSEDCGEKYVVMIDAGSTGSRVHVYTFDTCVSPPKLLNEAFDMLKPGLSSFDTDTVGAAQSLDPLLAIALKTVPKDKQSCTPVAVKATAGLRLLGEDKSDAILKEVRRHLEEDFPFPVVDGDGVSIMDGSDEGVYAWVTTNYLLGNIGSAKKTPTTAVFDLGGGSTQIVFEPSKGEEMIEGEHKYSLSFGGRDFTLYQFSHLGYGLMQGRRKINSMVLSTALQTEEHANLKPAVDKSAKAEVEISHPCIPPGVVAENIEVELDDNTKYVVNFKSASEGADEGIVSSVATQCKFLAESILNKDLECESKPCSFNGIYQPSLRHQFPEESEMYIFSYFYDRLHPLGMPSSFSLEEMKEMTKVICSGSKHWESYLFDKNGIEHLEKEPQWCLDLSFMTSLLHTGYDIPLKRELKTADKISDNELGWCLGASLPLLEPGTASGWKCKVSKDV
ncbi:unnamed protein product [Kuraishia capsulata CBS 1993]|uniref:guanosine-diphosphatase n=1 Tax=Kuraishia capsulata CBS 1993 TaxID=1382522 RepID=W6MTP9_9ASCO|nr:uncharacterized protein KUCA_T00004576001 [Kuraishia capsulata CBS 1993]CDK28592.1 unnamed protein product [Kuraishia capsulata CBS 1993]